MDEVVAPAIELVTRCRWTVIELEERAVSALDELRRVDLCARQGWMAGAERAFDDRQAACGFVVAEVAAHQVLAAVAAVPPQPAVVLPAMPALPLGEREATPFRSMPPNVSSPI